MGFTIIEIDFKADTESIKEYHACYVIPKWSLRRPNFLMSAVRFHQNVVWKTSILKYAPLWIMLSLMKFCIHMDNYFCSAVFQKYSVERVPFEREQREHHTVKKSVIALVL